MFARLGRRPRERRRPAEHEQRPQRPHRHQPVVRGLRLRRRRPRRADRQHRRRPARSTGRRVQHLHRPVLAVRRADGEPQALARPRRSSCTRSRRARAPTRRWRRCTAAPRHGTASPTASSASSQQYDAAWDDQKGGSRDPQPGPAHGVARRPHLGRHAGDPGAGHDGAVEPPVVRDRDRPVGRRAGPDTIVFTVFRTGNVDQVVISLTLSGTATRNTDYTIVLTTPAPGVTLTGSGNA